MGSLFEKLYNFTKYVPTMELRKFLYRDEIYQQNLNVHGSIVEAGVLYGGGLMTWGHFSEIYESVHHLRKVIGFDTFEGFPSISKQDNTYVSEHVEKGDTLLTLTRTSGNAIDIFHGNCFPTHIPKVQIIRGDVTETLPKYLKENPHLVVSLLHLYLDIYEPTKIMLKLILPRIPKGGIVAFYELNQDAW